MRLVHYGKEPVTFNPHYKYRSGDRDHYFKPHGLWISDADSYGWKEWCTAEEFALEHLEYEHLIELDPDNNVLFIRNVEELDKFHEQYCVDILAHVTDPRLGHRKDWINWTWVYPLYQGIIITPYLWERRMFGYMWYYGWDCAGGCIWDLNAIRTFKLLFKQLTKGT